MVIIKCENGLLTLTDKYKSVWILKDVLLEYKARFLWYETHIDGNKTYIFYGAN